MEAMKLLHIAKGQYNLGALIEALHHSTSPARGPVQTSMQTTVTCPNGDAALRNPQRTGNCNKKFTILGRHPRDELAR